MFNFHKSRSRQVVLPLPPIEIRTKTLAVPPFAIVTTRIGGKQDTAGFQRLMECAQHAIKFRARHMEQHSVGEDAIEMVRWKIQRKEILQPYFTPTVLFRQFDERTRAIKSRRVVTRITERLQISARAATEVENIERRLTAYVVQQSRHVLANVVMQGAVTVTHCVGLVVADRTRRGFFTEELVRYHATIRFAQVSVRFDRQEHTIFTPLGLTRHGRRYNRELRIA